MTALVLVPDPQLVAAMRLAAVGGTFDGRPTSASQAYLDRCRRVHRPSGTLLIFTRDTGHHTSGWFRNPDYERCLHLSLSFFEPGASPLDRRPHDAQLARAWAALFFGDALRLAWGEPPVSPRARELEVWHYRLFCDQHWQPIHPRGEVYSSEFTERGWTSASELFALTGQPEPWSPLRP